MTTKHTPSLFIFKTTETVEDTTDDGSGATERVTCEMIVDLEKVTLIARRPVGGGYWLNTGGPSIPVPEAAGAAILNAWIAFRGKFIPGQSS